LGLDGCKVRLFAACECGIQQDKDISNEPDDNTVQEYNPLMKNDLYLKEGSNTSLMAVFPHNKIAVFTAADFKTVNFSNYTSKGMRYTFHMRVYDADIIMGKGIVAMR
jgi:hypothetical protein